MKLSFFSSTSCQPFCSSASAQLCVYGIVLLLACCSQSFVVCKIQQEVPSHKQNTRLRFELTRSSPLQLHIMKSLSVFVVALSTLPSCSGFSIIQTPPTSTSSGSLSTSFTPSTLCLLPEQAADLEARAYDLMKEAMESESPSSVPQQQDSDGSGSGVGPIQWCRERLQNLGSAAKDDPEFQEECPIDMMP